MPPRETREIQERRRDRVIRRGAPPALKPVEEVTAEFSVHT